MRGTGLFKAAVIFSFSLGRGTIPSLSMKTSVYAAPCGRGPGNEVPRPILRTGDPGGGERGLKGRRESSGEIAARGAKSGEQD